MSKPMRIPEKQLQDFYIMVGKTIASWLGSLECPDCKAKSDLDWLLKEYSGSTPKLICRRCQRQFPIKDLKFKQHHIEQYRGSLMMTKLRALPNSPVVVEQSKEHKNEE